MDMTIIGAGLAGCEAAWQAARLGLEVRLYEMKPQRFSAAHQSPELAELVCSNSLRGAGLQNAVGCLKEELRRVGSLFMNAADATAVPAGGALAVAREEFSRYITQRIEAHPRITLIREEITRLPQSGITILATGPLTSDALAKDLEALTGADNLYFYDAIAPIIEADSIDLSIAWRASRYAKGGADYLNCPLNADQYRSFVADLLEADKVPARDFEQLVHFEGCMPIEALAERGPETLAFGPMKPVGLDDPRTGRRPHAVVQLRQDDRHASLYNMVGFQTRLTYPEQQRIFRRIPGLAGARFARLGSMHRNTFINAPSCLTEGLQFRRAPHIHVAGQLSGVEGYVESAACGLLAGLFAAARANEARLPAPPPDTALGSLLRHLLDSDPASFQPMNVNYGLFPPLNGRRMKRSARRLAMAERALDALEPWRRTLAAPVPAAGAGDRNV